MNELVPIPSATVTLVRDTGAGPEVLLMQRNLKSGFVPGAYVFPGGALDAEDNFPAMHALCAGITDAQASGALGVAQGGLAYWAAAIRESFEEAGLLVAYDAGGRIVALDEPHVAERFRRHRHALNQGERHLLDILQGEKLTLAADQLVYFSRWITPVSAPRRYDTRFFAAAAPPAQAPLHDNHETISHVWVRPGAALDRHRKDDFKMRLPTVRTLEEFAAYDSVAALMRTMRAKRDIPAILPRISKAGARLLPGEPGYAEMVASELQGQWKI
ncbi:MAG: NUDIX domain-containing protein [Betaproteobacteria bacterium]|nr:NUDIX domain-containing protein [Betaproteobacteria bacterium]